MYGFKDIAWKVIFSHFSPKKGQMIFFQKSDWNIFLVWQRGYVDEKLAIKDTFLLKIKDKF